MNWTACVFKLGEKRRIFIAYDDTHKSDHLRVIRGIIQDYTVRVKIDLARARLHCGCIWVRKRPHDIYARTIRYGTRQRNKDAERTERLSNRIPRSVKVYLFAYWLHDNRDLVSGGLLSDSPVGRGDLDVLPESLAAVGLIRDDVVVGKTGLRMTDQLGLNKLISVLIPCFW